MATRELLLVVLVMILAGISIAVAITVLNEHNKESNKEAIRQEMLYMASNAQSHYYRPISLGGGGSTFENISYSDLGVDSVNQNGEYLITDKTTTTFILTGITRDKESRIVGIVTKEGLDFQ